MITAVQQSATARSAWATEKAGSLSGGGRLRAASGETSTLRAGFGDGTVSVPVATVKTLGKGLEGARRVVPSLSDLQQELRSRLAEERSSTPNAASGATGLGIGQTSATQNTSPLGARTQAASQDQGAGLKSVLGTAANERAARAMFEIQADEQPGSYSRTGASKRAEQSPSVNLLA